MTSAAIHLVHRNPTGKRRHRLPEARRTAPRHPVRPDRPADSERAGLPVSTAPLWDRVEILRRMPSQAITPVLLELLDRMSGPILLTENSPAGELREMPAARRMPARAA